MSTVSDQVEAYIAYKQGLGVTMRSEASVMRQLGRFAASVGHDGLNSRTYWASSSTRFWSFDDTRAYPYVFPLMLPASSIGIR